MPDIELGQVGKVKHDAIEERPIVGDDYAEKLADVIQGWEELINDINE